jgi:hypothetical protein
MTQQDFILLAYEHLNTISYYTHFDIISIESYDESGRPQIDSELLTDSFDNSDEEYADVQQIQKLESAFEKTNDDDEVTFLNMEVEEPSNENDELCKKLCESDIMIKSLSLDVENAKKKINRLSKLLRDTAMNHILSMDSLEFQERLLFGQCPEFKLPKFRRAVEGDEDYKDHFISLDIRSETSFPRRRLSSAEIDRNICNFADANRGFLRYISEEDFKIACYEDYTPSAVP